MSNIDDFQKIDPSVVEIKAAEPHPEVINLLIIKSDAGRRRKRSAINRWHKSILQTRRSHRGKDRNSKQSITPAVLRGKRAMVCF